MPRLTLSRTMQADLKQAKSEAGVESHIHDKSVQYNIFAAKRSGMLECSCLWLDFITKLIQTVFRMSSVTPLIEQILLLYRIL